MGLRAAHSAPQPLKVVQPTPLVETHPHPESGPGLDLSIWLTSSASWQGRAAVVSLCGGPGGRQPGPHPPRSHRSSAVFTVQRGPFPAGGGGKAKVSGRPSSRKAKSPAPGLASGDRPPSVSSVHSEGDCNRRTPLTNRVWEDRPSSAGGRGGWCLAGCQSARCTGARGLERGAS